jgi:glycerol-3-phosphate dehydrogenase (NAD(P)+)
MATIAVLGAGSWGTALGVHLGRVGHTVRLWARDSALVDEMTSRRANSVYLPDVMLADNLSVTPEIDRAVRGARWWCVPCRRLAAAGAAEPRRVPRDAIIVRATGTRSRHASAVSEIIAQEAGPHRPVVVLSGKLRAK